MNSASKNCCPAVTVIIPTHNRVEKLRCAIDSVLWQTYPNVVIRVYDNASEDGTGALCRDYQSKYTTVEYVHRPNNLGMVRNFFEPLRELETEYFLWLSDDDRLKPNFISVCMAGFEKNCQAVMSFADAELVHPDGRTVVGNTRNRAIEENNPISRLLSYYSVWDDNSIFFAVYKADVAKEYCFGNSVAEDRFFCAYMASCGDLVHNHSSSSDRVVRCMNGASQNPIRLQRSFGMKVRGQLGLALSVARAGARSILANAETPSRTFVLGGALHSLIVFSMLFYQMFFRKYYQKVRNLSARVLSRVFVSPR